MGQLLIIIIIIIESSHYPFISLFLWGSIAWKGVLNRCSQHVINSFLMIHLMLNPLSDWLRNGHFE